ncbi:MAG: polyprenyl synthetase family protein [Alphaproteobacteria bacterium]|nr:polyprenyl synthetase family protein [Alphaproteobacteria bacterium]
MPDIRQELASFTARFNNDIAALFQNIETPEGRVVCAMKYSVSNGGKRLRPFLVCQCAALFGVDYAKAFMAAASLEMLHTYSLIHDDLPAMDNDDLRRGKATCHKAFDEATAILAGDGLLTLAFEILADSDYTDEVKIRLIKLMAQNAGAFEGMVAGQMLDLYAEKLKVCDDEKDLITRIEKMKTGCLLLYACQAGAIIGGANAQEFEALSQYARKIGQAFQIADDILDVEGNQALVGKTLQKDLKQNKMTFVSCYGLKSAKKMAEELAGKAKDDLAVFGGKAEILKALADFIVNREY